MSGSLLHDAFAHHLWATERLIDACGELDAQQLNTPVPGTYGSIIATLRHIVSADRWYLSFHPPGAELEEVDDENTDLGLDELRSAMRTNGAAWTELLAGELDADSDVPQIGDGWEFHAPLGFRLAQVIHHGTDHRSQVCTALTSLGLAPPEIDVWAYGEATNRTREVER